MKTNGKRIAVAAVLSVVGLEGVASGDVIEHDLKLTPPETAPYLFGDSVSVSGSVAVVSAIAGTNGMNYGAAYALDVNTGEVLFELLPEPDGGEPGYDLVGRAIASTDHFAVVTAAAGFLGGTAKVFDLATGQQLFSLDPELKEENELYDGFGFSVAASNSLIVIGAPNLSSPPVIPAAYVFDATTGDQLFKFLPAKASPVVYPDFGASVAVSDTVVAVVNDGAEGYVNVYDALTGELLFDLFPTELEAVVDARPLKLAASDTRILVGAPVEEVPDNSNGLVFVFDAQTGDLLHTLSVDNGDRNNYFGWSVDIDGSLAIIGTLGSSEVEDAPGAAYVFDLNTGELLHELVPDEDSLIDDFGYSVSIDGTTALVGKPHDAETVFGAGAAYRFDLPLDCPGDATGNDTVDLADLNLVLANFGSTTGEGDVTGDGQVDLADLNLVLANFGTSCG